MEAIVDFIQQNVHLAPYVTFGLLLLAGFNIPISEDLMLFISGTLAAKYPDHLVPLLTGVFFGAYLSDLICYWMGRLLGPKLWDIKFFANMVSQDKVSKIHNYYEKYGIITLILGRFIPFGVRNGLFLTAGLGKMNFLKFSLSDLTACVISTSVYFPLYYKYGSTVVEYVKKGNVVIFTIAILVVLAFIVKKKRKKARVSI